MERKSKYSEAYREKMPQVESIFMKKITQVHSGADSVKEVLAEYVSARYASECWTAVCPLIEWNRG